MVKEIKKLCFLFCLLTAALCLTEYKVSKKQEASSSLRLWLTYTGHDSYYAKEKSVIVKNLLLELKCLAFRDFNLKITDQDNKRYEVPQGGIFPTDPQADFTFPCAFSDIIYNFNEEPFSINITRRTDGTVIFDSSSADFIYSDYYLQIATTTSTKLYGFSERFTSSFRLRPGKWTTFPRDRGQMMDDGIGKQTHGYYPIYVQRENNGKFHIAYFRSSNALDAIIEEDANKNYTLTYKTIGGIIDFRFFLGDENPETLVNRFQAYLGRSAVPPFWSLGFHQCRWGYKDIDALETVLQKYRENEIPLDNIWSDIDYMQDYETFTINQQKFPLDRMAKITDNYHFIPIIEPSIRNGQGYAYEEGKKRNVFIQSAEGEDQIGEVWAGKVVFPDFFHPNGTNYWVDMLQHLYQKVKFAGAWIDMNQISNLCNGPCSTPTGTSKMDFTNDIPYHPGNDTIETQAIPLNATHYGEQLQQNVHTFFGFMETHATNLFLNQKGRPFIITRSNTLGSNKYGFHWTGDNYANFSFLKTSISGNFLFNVWGIQMVGSDICGFGGNATEENCARWFQLGSLFPFARNHNQIQAIDQEPYALGPRVLKSSQVNIKFRYSMLKAYYREFINRKGFGSIFKPLFFVFFKDENTFKDEIADTQFMLGNTLMSAPVVEEGAVSRSVYFPQTTNWYDLHEGQFYAGGSIQTINNEMDELVPLFLKEGSTTFIQDVSSVLKTSDLNSKFKYVGAFSLDQRKSNSTYYRYTSEGGLLSIKNYDDENMILSCLDRGCDYQIISVLQNWVNDNRIDLTLEIIHFGNKQTIEEMMIVEFAIYTKEGKFSVKAPEGVSINGNGKKVVSVKSIQEQ